VTGAGPVDLVFVNGLFGHIEAAYDLPGYGEFIAGLSRFSRVLAFDKRGSGMSDRIVGAPPLEDRIRDVSAVMDAVGSERAVLLGVSEGGPMSILMSAMHPERVQGLVLYGTYARLTWAPDFPLGIKREAFLEGIRRGAEAWDDPAAKPGSLPAPSLAGDEAFQEGLGALQSPGLLTDDVLPDVGTRSGHRRPPHPPPSHGACDDHPPPRRSGHSVRRRTPAREARTGTAVS
jgi:pimeloyl-ACP methyl ester carboxylesterase